VRAKIPSIEANASAGRFKLMTLAQKQNSVLKLIRRKSCDMPPYELKMIEADLSQWQNKFLASAKRV
jgi:hypothetical protein